MDDFLSIGYLVYCLSLTLLAKRVLGALHWRNSMPPLVSLLVYLSVAQVALFGAIAFIVLISLSKNSSDKQKNQAVLSSR